MKKLYSAKSYLLGLALLLVITTFGASLGPAGQASAETAGTAAATAVSSLHDSVASAVYGTAELILKNGAASDWQAIGVTAAGYQVQGGYLAKLEADVKAAKGMYSRATDYARITLAVKALGGDPEKFAGYNLIEKLYSNDKLSGQTLNQYVYTLLALDSGSYSVPDSAKWTKAKLVAEILAKQNKDGGFALTGSTSDPDMTAMVLNALAGHKAETGVKAAGDRAVAWLAAAQDANGGYGASSESVAQAIIGLSAYGVDAAGADFTKNKVNLVSKLLSFAATGGGFAHTAGGAYDAIATEQGLQALDAYLLFGAGGKLYDFSKPAAALRTLAQVTVEGPAATLLQSEAYAGNVLEALEKTTAAKNLKLVKATGNYVTEIGGIAGGQFGGWDGWMYIVSRGGQWMYPSVAMSDFTLEQGDHVLVYYGGDATQVVDAVKLSAAKPVSGKAFTVTVTQKQWIWNNATFTSDPVTSPAAGVQVTVGGKTVTTDVYGAANFATGLPTGRYTLTVSGYSKDNAPKVVRYTQPLTVAASGTAAAAFADAKQISAWAADSVQAAYEQKLMEGVSGTTLLFAPKQNITRAQFAALLLRVTGQEPAAAAAAPGFSDVKAGAWYYETVAQAKALGIISGVTATTFNPNGVITREDMAVMIARALKLDTAAGQTLSFSDEKQISAYALAAVRTVADLGIMSGANGAFAPKQVVTREMAAVVAVRLP